VAWEPDRPPPNLVPVAAPTPTPFDQRPVDDSVPVFIPGGHAAPVPDALPGYSPTLTLTFDDCGTADQIEAVVEALAAVDRTGIFFITGQCRDHFPWLVGTLLAAGDQVCNHTYSHPDLTRLTDAAVRAQIAQGVMTGCPWFRPPYGSWDGPGGRIARIAAEFGLQPMLWDVDSRDWAGAPADQIATLARARGGIVLLHLHGANTAEAIRLIG
jgi:peptidoglycan/xylan/chitin deacetylase (PgdA/CDA1 family)